LAKGKARKQNKGKPLFGGLPWFAWLGIGLGVAVIVVLVCTLPIDQAGGPSDYDGLKAAIIDQLYAFDYSNQGFIEQVTGTLESDGFQVDLYQGDQVTVDLYRRLATYGYQLIIFRAHSGVIKAEGEEVVRTSLFTSEGYSSTKYVREQLNEELAQARVGEGPFYFAIGSKFITDRMKGQFDDTVIIITGCSCLYLHDLAQAFSDKGASAYLAWDRTVSLDYVDDSTIALIDNLCSEGLTIEEAVAKTTEEKGPDPEWGSVLKYYPAQCGNKTIEELIGG